MSATSTSPVVSATRDLGIRNGGLYLLGRAMQKLSRGSCRLIRYYVVAQPVPADYAPVCKPSDTDMVAVARSADPVTSFFPRPSHVIESRFARQHTCLVATSKGGFSGFLWYANVYYEEDEVHCRFVIDQPGEGVWDYDVYVEPRFRLGRTFARLWDAANMRLSEQGVKWSFSRISAFNSQSLQSHKRMGFHVLAGLNFFCLGPLQLMISSCSPFINISWNGMGRPVIHVKTKTQH